MNVSAHDLVRGLAVGTPLLLIGFWGFLQRRRAKENNKTSAVLRSRN